MDGMLSGTTQLPAIGDDVAGKYRIEGTLGQGGMGAVFSARNLMTGKRVAIKWLLPENASGTNRERLLREARIACSVEHPNIVDIYDVGDHQGGLFLVMEYLRGKSLADVLAERGRLDPAELIAMLVPAMRGVHAAHQAGVIHRDLKPENILLSEVDGTIIPKVVDFGVSKTVGASSVPHSSLTRTGALVGTPHYMALEQVDGSNQIDPRTDVYAFGVILYRALTGHFPFDGSSLGEVILKIGTKEPAPPCSLRPDLSEELEAVILRAMARVRDQRFHDCEALARALEPFAPWVRFREATDSTGRVPLSHASSAEPRMMMSAEPRMMTPQHATPQHVTPQHAMRMSAAASEARVTPELSVERTERTRAFWVGAGLGLFALLAIVVWLSQRGDSRAVTVEPPAPPVGVAAPPVADDAPEPAQEPAVEAPAQAVAPAPAQAAPEATTPQPAQAGDPAAAASDARDTKGDDARAEDHDATSRTKPRREGSHTRDRAPKLIPGERTKGLSADDF